MEVLYKTHKYEFYRILPLQFSSDLALGDYDEAITIL